MSSQNPKDNANATMLELFRAEAETQTAILTEALLDLERGQFAAPAFEILMRAAHSLKGAARIVNLPNAVRVAHALEECFVATRRNEVGLSQSEIDVLLRGVDLLAEMARRRETELLRRGTEESATLDQFFNSLAQVMARASRGESPLSNPGLNPAKHPGSMRFAPTPGARRGLTPAAGDPAPLDQPVPRSPAPFREPRKTDTGERVLRLSAENLNRLLGLAGESLVESRWLGQFTDSLERLKRRQIDLRQQLEKLQQQWGDENLPDPVKSAFSQLFRQLTDAHHFLMERLQELDGFDRRTTHLAQRLYLEVLRTRMRPFSDGVRRFPRMVRDLARTLGKEVKLEIVGEATQVDRDILERLETPLAHLLRNAVDHGCEAPGLRRKLGKPQECCLRLEARHSAGVLLITVSDDGMGVDLERLRRGILQRGLASQTAAERLSEPELLEFLFLPGFTLREEVTEISGRGFGLDIVQNMVRSVRGTLRLSNQPGHGLRLQLQLPLTLSVVRALLVEVGGEPYAIPLNQITRTLKLPGARLEALEGKQLFRLGDQHVGLVAAHEVLDCRHSAEIKEELPIVVLSERNTHYGMLVDRFLDERELVVQPLDARLGEVPNISAAALMEDGTPVLILDVEALVRSIEKHLSERHSTHIRRSQLGAPPSRIKRVLAVDDSLTVRELERQVLLRRGYLVDVAGNGHEAWQALRSGDYDLVITDVEMPDLNGFELTRSLRNDPRLHRVPVLILSHRDCEEDRLKGLEAGADYFLSKENFNDEALLEAVIDLVGKSGI